ncbi:hypothetical protein DPMN_078023 [Dreissena polymorpha]|uniref:Uncharacterized protein n=1 Tax=Dreissena polymorpha TaxID=45954 RepID=A0A9D3YQC8_DREPO|nr:hypothetical protein DPMN_078023 [Dreissena polymorpha]
MWSHRGVEITTLYGHTQRVLGCDIYVEVAGETEGSLKYALFCENWALCMFVKCCPTLSSAVCIN